MAERENREKPTRRALAGVTAGLTLAATAPAHAADPWGLPAPALDYVFAIRAKLAPIIEFSGRDGPRRTIPIVGGTVEGPKLTGEVLSGGSDWQEIRADGSADLVARYALKAADGAIIGLVNAGIRTGPPDVLARLRAGETVDPKLYYFRATPVFDVGAGPHAWLTKQIFVCVGARLADEVRLAIYAVS